MLKAGKMDVATLLMEPISRDTGGMQMIDCSMFVVGFIMPDRLGVTYYVKSHEVVTELFRSRQLFPLYAK